MNLYLNTVTVTESIDRHANMLSDTRTCCQTHEHIVRHANMLSDTRTCCQTHLTYVNNFQKNPYEPRTYLGIWKLRKQCVHLINTVNNMHSKKYK